MRRERNIEKMRKKRIQSFDFIRCISMIIIIVYHWESTYKQLNVNGYHYYLPLIKDIDWGRVGVTMFFILSGASLQYNYSKQEGQWIKFYKKRWISIFPMFYMIWLFVYIIFCILNRSMFFAGSPILFLLTLAGVDGYFYDIIHNYYMVGEWFLGVIIIIYILYPILNYLRKNYKYTIDLFLFVAYICSIVFPTRGLTFISYIAKFWLGMVVIENKEKLINKYIGTGCAVAIVLVMVTQNRILYMNYSDILGVFLFLFFMNIGDKCMKNKEVSNVVLFLSELSYPIFLWHHWIECEILNLFSGKTIYGILNFILLLITFLTIILVSIVTIKVNNILIQKVHLYKEERRKDIYEKSSNG